MPGPLIIASAAATETATAAALAEGTSAAAVGAGTELASAHKVLAATEVGSGLDAAGGSTQALVEALEIDTEAIARGVLDNAEAAGARLESELNNVTGKLPRWGTENFAAAQTFEPGSAVEAESTGDVVFPNSIVESFRWLQDHLENAIPVLEQRDPGFREELSRRVEQLKDAKGPADRDKTLQRIRISSAGRLGESIVKDQFQPYFNAVDTQRLVEMPGGAGTKIDLLFIDAKQPMVLNPGVGVPEAGNLAVEVKTGQPGYIDSETQHMVKQSEGHQEVGATSLVVTCRGSADPDAYVREAINATGSRIMALLPDKGTMDEVLMRIVGERAKMTS